MNEVIILLEMMLLLFIVLLVLTLALNSNPKQTNNQNGKEDISKIKKQIIDCGEEAW